jgi:hypothetical protein
MPIGWATRRVVPWVLILAAFAGCADRDAADHAGDVQTAAAVIPPIPRLPEPRLIGRFICDGSILHPSIDTKIESDVRFWFDVNEDYVVRGYIDLIGPPLGLAGGNITGRVTPKFDTAGDLIGGRMVVSWPHVRDDAQADFQVMRETFVRAGHTVNGVGQVIRRTSKHTYLSARIWLDPRSSPAIASFRRAAFVNATCFPEIDLPATPPPGR